MFQRGNKSDTTEGTNLIFGRSVSRMQHRAENILRLENVSRWKRQVSQKSRHPPGRIAGSRHKALYPCRRLAALVAAAVVAVAAVVVAVAAGGAARAILSRTRPPRLTRSAQFIRKR